MQHSHHKTIWIFNHYAISPFIGGITRHYDLAEELAKKGYDVYIFASSFDHKTRKETKKRNKLFEVEDINGVKFVWIRTFPYQKNDLKRIINIFSYALNLLRVLKKFTPPKTIIASSFHPLTWIVGYLAAKKTKAKFIAEVRDFWPQSAIDLGAISENGIITKILRKIESFIYTKAENIIVLFPKAYEYIKERGTDPEKVVYIPNGTSVERFDKLKVVINDEVEQILNEHKNYFKAVYVGALGLANAMETIVKAAKLVQDKVKDIHFIIVGDGPEKEKLMDMKRELGIENIFFYPPVPKTAIPYLLNNIDICLVSMHDLAVYKYGISLNKLFDYLCAAKPTIFAGKVANDIIKEAEAGISVPPYDADKFAQAVIGVYNLPEEKRMIMGENGRKYFKEKHDMSILAEKLESIL